MANSYNSSYDQLSVALAETFRTVVDDNVFISNMVFERNWEDAERVEPGRYLALPILTAKNQNATAFGQFDEVPSSPQTILSVGTFPWSFYVATIQMDYQTVSLNRGQNVRADLIASQLETAVASLGDVMGTDLTNATKSPATQNAVSALGILEASDDGTNFNTYGNITRTGSGSFANWQGNDIRTLTTGNIGTATNDPTWSLFTQLYTNCSVGAQTPTEVYTDKQGISSYMYVLSPVQRVTPGDMANIGFAGARLFGADMLADDHILAPTNTTKLGVNYIAINRRHTKFYYPGTNKGDKGFDFIPWLDSGTTVAKLARYVTAFQYASSQPRLNGQLLNVNQLANL